MDAIQLLMVLFLNLNEPCSAMPTSVERLGGEDYQTLRYDCGAKAFKIWSRRCPEGEGFWGRPFFLEEVNSQSGIYVNRFGEVQTGWHVTFDEAYTPRCGT